MSMDTLLSVKHDLRTLVRGTGMAFGGAIVGNGLVYVYGLIFGRFLGADKAGLFFLALVLMQVISSVSRLGLSEGLLRFVAIHHGSQDMLRIKGTVLSAFTLAGGTSILLAALLFAFAKHLSGVLFKLPELVYYVRWFALCVPFFVLFAIVLHATQALKRMDLVVILRDLVQPVTMILIALIGFAFLHGPGSFLVAYLGSFILALLASVYLLCRAYPGFRRPGSAIFEWKVLLAFSLPVAASDVAYYLFRWSDTLLLSYFRSPSEVGIYNAALRTTLLLNLLAFSANALYAPIIADHYHQNRLQEMEAILKTFTRWCLTLALPIVFSMALLSSDILLLWGPDFLSGSTALVILSLSQLIFVYSCLLSFTLLMCGRQYVELVNTVAVTVLNIVMNLFLIPRYGMNGAATSMCLSQLAGFVLRWLQIYRIFNFQVFTNKHMKPLIAMAPVSILFLASRGILMRTASSISFGCHLVAMVLLCVVVVVCYFAVLYCLGLEREDLLVLGELKVRGSGRGLVRRNKII